MRIWKKKRIFFAAHHMWRMTGYKQKGRQHMIFEWGGCQVWFRVTLVTNPPQKTVGEKNCPVCYPYGSVELQTWRLLGPRSILPFALSDGTPSVTGHLLLPGLLLWILTHLALMTTSWERSCWVPYTDEENEGWREQNLQCFLVMSQGCRVEESIPRMCSQCLHGQPYVLT